MALFSKSMIAVSSKAALGNHGKSSEAISHMSVTWGFSIVNCQSTYEVSERSVTYKLEKNRLTPSDDSHAECNEESSHPS
jgi:hypothetical protein